MKRFITLILTITCLVSAWSFKGYKNMYLHLLDGTIHRFEMNNETTLKYTPTEFIIVNQGVIYTYSRQEVSTIKFEADLTALPSVVSPVETAICKVQGRDLLLTSVDEDTDLYIYAIDGKIVMIEHVSADTHKISLDNLVAGIYIVAIGDKNEKILVK